jgi:hypothetical protein
VDAVKLECRGAPIWGPPGPGCRLDLRAFQQAAVSAYFRIVSILLQLLSLHPHILHSTETIATMAGDKAAPAHPPYVTMIAGERARRCGAVLVVSRAAGAAVGRGAASTRAKARG